MGVSTFVSRVVELTMKTNTNQGCLTGPQGTVEHDIKDTSIRPPSLIDKHNFRTYLRYSLDIREYIIQVV